MGKLADHFLVVLRQVVIDTGFNIFRFQLLVSFSIKHLKICDVGKIFPIIRHKSAGYFYLFFSISEKKSYDAFSTFFSIIALYHKDCTENGHNEYISKNNNW